MRSDGMRRHREAERRQRRVQLAPVRTAVGGAEDAVVMLAPQYVGLRRAARDGVRILDLGVERLVGWHVLGTHAMRGLRPRGARIARDPGPAAAHAHQHRAVRERTD